MLFLFYDPRSGVSISWQDLVCLFLDTFLHYLNSPFLDTRSGLACFWRVVSPFYSLSDSSITLCDTCCDFVQQNRTEKTPSKSSRSSSEADLENIGSSTESVVSKTSLLWISMGHMGFRLYDYSLMPALAMAKKTAWSHCLWERHSGEGWDVHNFVFLGVCTCLYTVCVCVCVRVCVCVCVM